MPRCVAYTHTHIDTHTIVKLIIMSVSVLRSTSVKLVRFKNYTGR